jgi:glycerate 2-kinase
MPDRPHIETRTFLTSLFEHAIASAQPATCLPPHLPAPPPNGRILVLGAGKAAAAMAQATETHYAALDALDRIGGMVTTRHGYALPTKKIEVREAGHPVPDQASLDAARESLELAGTAGPDDVVLVLLSGGASALWTAPCGALTLPEKQELTRQLLKAGARIDEMNCIRKHLSRIKGGRLAAAATRNGARLITCAISDVPRDDPATIGSGPTVGDPTTLALAREIIDRYGIVPPPAVSAALKDTVNETPEPDAAVFDRSTFVIVAAPSAALQAAAARADEVGIEAEILGDSVEGEASDVAREHAEIALMAKRNGRSVLILSGGELTVTIRGGGRGGPNQEYALALAIALAGTPGITGLAGDTDGTDGGTGAADDPAGAYIAGDTLARAAALDLNPAMMLADNDSTTFFEKLGDLVRTGPTQTNVNDFRAILVTT